MTGWLQLGSSANSQLIPLYNKFSCVCLHPSPLPVSHSRYISTEERPSVSCTTDDLHHFSSAFSSNLLPHTILSLLACLHLGTADNESGSQTGGKGPDVSKAFPVFVVLFLVHLKADSLSGFSHGWSERAFLIGCPCVVYLYVRVGDVFSLVYHAFDVSFFFF